MVYYDVLFMSDDFDAVLFFGGLRFLPSRSELNRAKFGSFGYAALNKIPKAREANGERWVKSSCGFYLFLIGSLQGCIHSV